MTVDTREGVIAGTPAYMSPEQARGLPVDRRTDIWAFGCVLYAILTGRAAFAGATVTDTLAAVLSREPDWTSLPPGLTDSVSRLLVRALAKDPQQRLRDIGDAKLEIEAALNDRRESTRRVKGSQPARRAWQGPAIAAVLALAIAAGVAWRGMAPGPASIPAIGPLVRVTFDGGLTTEPTISADGRLIAYASNRSGEGGLDIWIQQASGGSAIRLTNDAADDREPSLSPDGSLVAFRSERTPRGIYVMPALGGDARLVAPNGMVPRFSPDGRSIAFWTGGWLAPRGVGQIRHTYIVSASGGEPTEVAGSLASVGDPAWSPDGASLLVFGRRTTSGDGIEPDWWNVPLNGGPVLATGVYKQLAAHGLEVNDTDLYPYPFAWTPNGALFAAADSGAGGTGEGDAFSIWGIALEPGTGRVAGDPVRLTSGTTFDTWPAVSRDGRMVFAVATDREFMFTLPLDANAGRVTGTVQRVREGTSVTGRPGASEDGRLLVFPRYEFGAGGVWIRDVSTGQERQLAATPRTPLNPIISTDGSWVAYTATTVERGGNAGPGIGYVVAVAGGAPRRVCDNCQIYQWSRDNQQIFIVETGARVIRLDVTTGSRAVVLAASAAAGAADVDGAQIDRPLLSPNQRWMVFKSRRKVYVAPLHPDRETPASEWILVHSSSGAERSAGLSPDGRLLYLLLEGDGFRCLYAVRVDPATGRPQGEPFLVHHFHDASLRWGSTGFGSATVTGMFVAYLHQVTGNIWTAMIEPPR